MFGKLFETPLTNESNWNTTIATYKLLATFYRPSSSLVRSSVTTNQKIEWNINVLSLLPHFLRKFNSIQLRRTFLSPSIFLKFQSNLFGAHIPDNCTQTFYMRLYWSNFQLPYDVLERGWHCCQQVDDRLVKEMLPILRDLLNQIQHPSESEGLAKEHQIKFHQSQKKAGEQSFNEHLY